MSDSDSDSMPEALEVEVLRALELPPAASEAAIGRLCAEHPQHGPEIRMTAALQRLDGDVVRKPAAVPTRIGPYRLESLLGEGGMGAVWLASQEQPVRRRVAIKLVKPGIDSREIVKRFEAERQALAMMEHSGIARVFEGGLTDDDRPYFVMEFVDGEPITSFCERADLALDRRLELVVQVCAAVAHAHQKGVIHRDLKPSNILVTEESGAPRVKIIDFGLARAIEGQQLTNTMLTMHGQVVGTPAFMSPEQATFDVAKIDTRTDIYSIGVVAYQLLTGELPFVFDDSKLDLAEIQRRICDEDPVQPSSRVAMQSGGALAARVRRLRRELDWIVMRALEKSPERRYPSAEALGADFRRFLADLPVEARPVSAFYQLRKFALRNLGLVTGVTVAVLALVVASVVSVAFGLQAIEDRNALVEASRRTERARSDAEAVAGFQAGVLARVDVRETGAVIVEQLRKDLLSSEAFAASPQAEAEVARMLKALNPANLAREAFDRSLLATAVEQIDGEFSLRPEVAARLYSSFAQVYLNLSMIDRGLDCCRRAYQLRLDHFGEDHVTTVSALGDLGVALINCRRFEEARPMLERAYQFRVEQVPHRSKLVAEAALRLASVYAELGELEPAERLAREARDCWDQINEIARRIRADSLLARLAHRQGRQDEAVATLEAALNAARNEFGPENETALNMANNFAMLLRQCGQAGRSAERFRELVPLMVKAFGDDDLRTLHVIQSLGISLSLAGNTEEGRRHLEDALRRMSAGRSVEDPMVRRAASILRRYGK